jgi:uridylate kinase
LQPVYKRILLKLSGEALMGQLPLGIDPQVLSRIMQDVVQLTKHNVQVAIVIGGGNLFRGAALAAVGINRITGDQMGMLATVMNALAMRDALEGMGMPTRILSAVPVDGLVERYERNKAMRYLNKQRVVIFAGGTGNPLFTTDSAASLRGIEINADVLLKATHVDGIYSADPVRHPNAVLYQRLTYQEALERELGVMDLTAFSQCRDHRLPIRVFNITKPGILLRIVQGADEGTLVDEENI